MSQNIQRKSEQLRDKYTRTTNEDGLISRPSEKEEEKRERIFPARVSNLPDGAHGRSHACGRGELEKPTA